MVNFFCNGAIDVLKSKIFRLLFPIFAPLLSAVLLVLAFPSYDVGWLAWVGFVPILIAISGSSPKRGFFLSFTTGLIFFPWLFHWILDFPGLTILHQSILGVYVAMFFGLFGVAFSFISRRCGVAIALIAAPFLWLPLEYIRSNLSFMALPWGLLAHSQYLYPPIIQVTSLTGVYGVSFLVLMANSAFTAMLLPLLYRSKETEAFSDQFISGRGRIAVVGTAALLTAMALFYVLVALSRPVAGKGFKISVVQGNIEQINKWDPKFFSLIMKTYAVLTQQASEHQPALIIWPEGATPQAITADISLSLLVKRITEEAGTYLLLGSAHGQKIGRKVPKAARYQNSAFLISPDKKAKTQRYDKIRLLPFGEYIPMEKIIPWSRIQVPEFRSLIAGKEFTIFEIPDFRFGVTICWEHIFPDLVRQFVKRGAQFIVNITNEVRLGKTAAPYQLLAAAVFRAVENRVYVVRCANTGVSCFIDPYGRIVDRVKDESGRDIFVRGVLTETVIPMDSKTTYTRYGDWFVWLCIVSSIGFLIMAFFRKKCLT